MKRRKRDPMRIQLLERARRLEDERVRLRVALQSRDGSGPEDEGDRAAEEVEFDVLAAQVAEIEKELQQVREAVAKFGAGTYGRCESCGRPIPRRRLKALPSASLCVKCKEAEERAVHSVQHTAQHPRPSARVTGRPGYRSRDDEALRPRDFSGSKI